MKKLFEKLKEKKPSEAGVAGLVFALLSTTYGLVVRARLFLYRVGLLSSKRVEGVRIVSIGNLTVGGTGKTPVAIMIARMLTEGGKKIAVVSRGYGRKSNASVQVVSGGSENLCEYPEAADEALVCAKELENVPVICAPRRIDGIRKARESFGAEVVLLDDAFSHLAARRDVNLLLVDALIPFGNGWMLPAGPLREPLSSMKRADAVLITRANHADAGKIESVKKEIRKISGETDIFIVDILPAEIIQPDEEKIAAGELLKGKSVYLLSGIASPAQFERTVKGLGAEIEKHFIFPDHHPYTENELEEITKSLPEESLVVTTQKDFVRIPHSLKKHFHQLTINASVRKREEFVTFLKTSPGYGVPAGDKQVISKS